MRSRLAIPYRRLEPAYRTHIQGVSTPERITDS